MRFFIFGMLNALNLYAGFSSSIKKEVKMQKNLNLDNYINSVLGSVIKEDIVKSLMDYSQKLVDTTLESNNSQEVSK